MPVRQNTEVLTAPVKEGVSSAHVAQQRESSEDFAETMAGFITNSDGRSEPVAVNNSAPQGSRSQKAIDQNHIGKAEPERPHDPVYQASSEPVAAALYGVMPKADLSVCLPGSAIRGRTDKAEATAPAKEMLSEHYTGELRWASLIDDQKPSSEPRSAATKTPDEDNDLGLTGASRDERSSPTVNYDVSQLFSRLAPFYRIGFPRQADEVTSAAGSEQGLPGGASAGKELSSRVSVLEGHTRGNYRVLPSPQNELSFAQPHWTSSVSPAEPTHSVAQATGPGPMRLQTGQKESSSAPTASNGIVPARSRIARTGAWEGVVHNDEANSDSALGDRANVQDVNPNIGDPRTDYRVQPGPQDQLSFTQADSPSNAGSAEPGHSVMQATGPRPVRLQTGQEDPNSAPTASNATALGPLRIARTGAWEGVVASNEGCNDGGLGDPVTVQDANSNDNHDSLPALSLKTSGDSRSMDQAGDGASQLTSAVYYDPASGARRGSLQVPTVSSDRRGRTEGEQQSGSGQGSESKELYSEVEFTRLEASTIGKVDLQLDREKQVERVAVHSNPNLPSSLIDAHSDPKNAADPKTPSALTASDDSALFYTKPEVIIGFGKSPGVARLEVELQTGSSIRASVRERSGAVELRVSTNDSRVAQELTGEIDKLRNSLDMSGLKLESAAVDYRDDRSERRQNGDPEPNVAKRDQSDDSRQVFTLQESDQ
jgi:hypothetical protein